MVDVQSVIKQREAQFVETRTKIEIEVNKFLESLKDIEDEIASIPGRPTGATAREILPELWSDNFNNEIYQEQLARLNSYIASVIAYSDKINEEALACLKASS